MTVLPALSVPLTTSVDELVVLVPQENVFDT